MTSTDAAQRIRNALADKPRGHRGDRGEQLHVELSAGDILACCDDAGNADARVNMLRKGSAAVGPESRVTIQADDAYYLLDALSKGG